MQVEWGSIVLSNVLLYRKYWLPIQCAIYSKTKITRTRHGIIGQKSCGWMMNYCIYWGFRAAAKLEQTGFLTSDNNYHNYYFFTIRLKRIPESSKCAESANAGCLRFNPQNETETLQNTSTFACTQSPRHITSVSVVASDKKGTLQVKTPMSQSANSRPAGLNTFWNHINYGNFCPRRFQRWNCQSGYVARIVIHWGV